jgi:hypothetical protein
LADDCALLARARRVADWVGEGRPVTPKGVLRPVDLPAAAAALGVRVPARVRTAADVEEIHRPWVAAQAAGWLRVTANRALATATADGDPVQRWWTAVEAVLRAESHDDRRCGALVLCRTLLTVLASEPPPAAPELAGTVHELFHHADYDDVAPAFSAFRRSVMPVDAGMELLGEIGAVDGEGRITALGRWMWERMAAEVPPPVTPELSAPQLLDRLATLTDDEVWRQAGRWLVGRDIGKAADELLTAAADAMPAQRVVAVDVVADLGEPALPAWRRALENRMLAPHARVVLAEFDPDDRDDDEDVSEPSEADRLWLAVEYALIALAADGPEEAYHVLREADGLDAVADSGHPGAADLGDALGDLIAGGGPSVPSYQLKISLSRVRPPVWRRVRVPATTPLDELHQIIQDAFDWDDDHLHTFTVDGRRYADPLFGLEECADESRVRLGRLFPRSGGTMTYVYDLGAWWEHQITVERIMDTEEPGHTPVCVGGKGDAPVEYWYPGCDRGPTPFDVAAINRRLAQDENEEPTGGRTDTLPR